MVSRMKYCMHCGMEIDAEDKICPFCSKNVSEEATEKIVKSNLECVKCHSKNVEYRIIKRQKRDIDFEEEQYTCKDCGRQFTDNNRLGPSFNNSPQIILNNAEKKLLKWIFIIVVVCIVVFNYTSNKSKEENSWTHYDCSGLPQMTFKQIKDGAPYDDEKYKNNSYIFTTTIKEINGREVVTPIEDGDYSGSYIYFNNEDAEKLKNYKEGDRITFCGKVTKISMYHKVYVKNASLIN